jgi:hypothetical protein
MVTPLAENTPIEPVWIIPAKGALLMPTIQNLTPSVGKQVITRFTSNLDHLTPTQREAVMYWVGGLAPLATNVTTPFFTKLRFDRAGLPDTEVHKNVVQESARQVVSAGTQIATYFGPSALLGAGLGKRRNKNLLMFLVGTVASFVGYAVIRPLISAELILRWLYPTASSTAAKESTPKKLAGHTLFVKPVTRQSPQTVFAGFA